LLAAAQRAQLVLLERELGIALGEFV